MNKLVARKCRVCGAGYESCYSCDRVRSWRALTDSLDHYLILCELMKYKSDRDAERSYKELQDLGVDFNSVGGFVPEIQTLLSEIYEQVNPVLLTVVVDAEDEPEEVEDDVLEDCVREEIQEDTELDEIEMSVEDEE